MRRTLVSALTALFTTAALPALAAPSGHGPSRPSRGEVHEFRQDRHQERREFREERQDFRQERREDRRELFDR